MEVELLAEINQRAIRLFYVGSGMFNKFVF